MTMRILFVAGDGSDSSQLVQALGENNYEVVGNLSRSDMSRQYVDSFGADLVVVNTNTPCAETLEQVRRIAQSITRPIVMFSKQGDSETIEQATRAGVSAYVVNDVSSHRIRPIFDAAMARFKELQRLKEELSETRSKLDERKTIDRAKGLLMSKRKLDENEAYRLLQKMAMEQNKKMGEVAKNILAMADLIG